jgi:DNA-directed RNA polymerase specialized sigma24 family protein
MFVTINTEAAMTEQQFQERYERLIAAAMQFASRHRSGKRDQEAIAVDAVAQLWERLRSEEIRNVAALLRCIVDRLCIKRGRSTDRAFRLTDEIVGRDSRPEDRLALDMFLQSLSPAERAIVEGREARQSFQSIADELRISRESVRMHFVRIRSRFHRELENPFSEN